MVRRGTYTETRPILTTQRFWTSNHQSYPTVVDIKILWPHVDRVKISFLATGRTMELTQTPMESTSSHWVGGPLNNMENSTHIPTTINGDVILTHGVHLISPIKDRYGQRWEPDRSRWLVIMSHSTQPGPMSYTIFKGYTTKPMG